MIGRRQVLMGVGALAAGAAVGSVLPVPISFFGNQQVCTRAQFDALPVIFSGTPFEPFKHRGFRPGDVYRLPYSREPGLRSDPDSDVGCVMRVRAYRDDEVSLQLELMRIVS